MNQFNVENEEHKDVGTFEINDDLVEIANEGQSFLLTPIIDEVAHCAVGFMILPPESQPREYIRNT